MKIKKCDIKEAEKFYNDYILFDFPKPEVKPFKTIKSLMERGLYIVLSFEEDNNLKAYAFLCYNSKKDYLLLDYYAVLKQYRGTGIGKKIFKILTNEFENMKGIIVEAENPMFSKDNEDDIIRKRRISFYEKCGLYDTGVRENVFEVSYVVLFKEIKGKAAQDDILSELEDIYKLLVRQPYYDLLVKFYI